MVSDPEVSMQAYSGCLRQLVVTSSTSKSAMSETGAAPGRHLVTNRVLHTRVRCQAVKTEKERSLPAIVSVTKDLSLPVILEMDFDKEESRIDKRTV